MGVVVAQERCHTLAPGPGARAPPGEITEFFEFVSKSLGVRCGSALLWGYPISTRFQKI
jgi:hypothetical protein